MAARATGMRGSLEQMMSQLKSSGSKDLARIIKSDVQGSLEAIIGSLEKLGTDEVGARVIHSGVGGITESDVTLAEASGVRSSASTCAPRSARAAERAGIEIRYYNIIYDLVDDVKKAMSACSRPRRETARQCDDPGGVQGLQGRQRGGLPGDRRRGRRGANCASSRQRGRAQQALPAQALQGRRARGGAPGTAWRSNFRT